jgi:4-amino-4-deoxy-L-arabinose transferase-like glycosyltransferase
MTRRQARQGRSRFSAPASPSSGSIRTRDFVLFCCAAVILCGALKVPSLLYPQLETDEQVYWQLAQNLADGGAYTLQGTQLLAESLPPQIYDRPLFHHPPLFPALLVPFMLLGARAAAVTVSWAGHFLVVIAVALVGRDALLRRSAPTLTSPAFWIPVLGVAADPLLMFVSRRIWIDSLLAGLLALSVAVLLVANGERRRFMLGLAGLLLGLAALAKLTALILAPLFLFAGLRQDTDWRQRGVSLLAITVPVVALVVPWTILFYLKCGVLVPSWTKPNAELLELYPFVRAAVERPWYYYLLKLTLVMPLALVPIWLMISDRAIWRNPGIQAAVGWFVFIVVAMTVMGIDGYGFQMRYIAPAVAAIYVIVILMLLERERPVFLMACACAMLVGTVTGAMHLLAPGFGEILSLAEVAGSFSL